MRGRLVLEAVGLIAVLAFVAAVAYLPHADSATYLPEEGPPSIVRLAEVYFAKPEGARDYPYTVHVDENVHWVAMASIHRAETLRYPDAYSGAPRDELPLTLRGVVHERGFHVAVLMLQEMTGVAWVDVFRYLPALWLAGTAFVLWAALRPWPGALAAAALVALVPTSARFLGPGFLVPIGFGLAWLAVALALLPEVQRKGPAVALLLLAVVWAFFIHLIAGFAALLLLLCALPFAAGNRRGVGMLALAALVPAAWLLQAFQGDVEREFDVIGTLPIDFSIFDQVGVLFLVAWALGVAMVALRPPRRAALPIQAATVASVLALVFVALHTVADLRLYTLYDRWHQPFALFAAVPAAYAMVTLGEVLMERLSARRLQRWRVARPAIAVCGIAALLLIASDGGVASHLDEPYYHVISDRDWAAFTWSAEHADARYEVFLAHPWASPILTALSGKRPYTWLAPGTPPIRGDEYDHYLAAGGTDGAWLVERDVSLVSAPAAPRDPAFIERAPQVYMLDETTAQALQPLVGAATPHT